MRPSGVDRGPGLAAGLGGGHGWDSNGPSSEAGVAVFSRRVSMTFFRWILILAWLVPAAVSRGAAPEVSQWHRESGHRWAELEVPRSGKSGFQLLDSGSTGLAFTNLLAEARGATNRVLWNGSGVAAGDVNKGSH
jgi:hypothetical protein